MNFRKLVENKAWLDIVNCISRVMRSVCRGDQANRAIFLTAEPTPVAMPSAEVPAVAAAAPATTEPR
ncbi:hypothetical protein HDU76_010820, partial [Blyttiomyces sp. JEL0837]